MRPIVKYHDIKGISYRQGWDLQTSYHEGLKEQKKAMKNLSEQKKMPQQNHLIFCEHNHVYTLGKSGKQTHLLLPKEQLDSNGIEYFKINRGGDITYHGPGQLTGYPIFDLDEFFTDVHRYVRTLEECVIELLAQYGITGIRRKEYTGVWVQTKSGGVEKICAIGVHLSRWVTMHGFALNVNTDLSYFSHIIPCGIHPSTGGVTSMQKILERKLDMSEVKYRLKIIFAQIFEFDYLE